MGQIYTVEQGDCLSSIAAHFGFADWRVIYRDSHNAAFRAKRPDPNLIFPGDELFIPDRNSGKQPASTDARHIFEVRRQQTRLRIFLRRDIDTVLSGANFVLAVDGQIFSGVTNDDGLVDKVIPATATAGVLKAFLDPGQEPLSWNLQLGALDPLETTSGIQARLNNLQFDSGPVDGIQGDLTTAAIEAFQDKFDLQVDGIVGPITRAKLKEVYGS